MSTQHPKPKAYNQRSVTRIVFAPAVADIEALTRAELDAGTDLSDAIHATQGWAKNDSNVDLPILGERTNIQIEGEQTYPESSISFWDDKVDLTLDALLAENVEGYVIILHRGDVADQPASIFPVRSKGLSRPVEVNNSGADLICNFVITSVPNDIAKVPA